MEDFFYDMGGPITLAISAVFTVICLAALVNAAKTERWMWFVLMLFVWPAAIAYMIFAYESPKKLHAAEKRARVATERRLAAKDRKIAELKRDVDELSGERVGAPETDPS